jgi:hypothetical protein
VNWFITTQTEWDLLSVFRYFDVVTCKVDVILLGEALLANNQSQRIDCQFTENPLDNTRYNLASIIFNRNRGNMWLKLYLSISNMYYH